MYSLQNKNINNLHNRNCLQKWGNYFKRPGLKKKPQHKNISTKWNSSHEQCDGHHRESGEQKERDQAENLELYSTVPVETEIKAMLMLLNSTEKCDHHIWSHDLSDTGSQW